MYPQPCSISLKPRYFPLLFWFSQPDVCAPFPPILRKVSSCNKMFCLVAFHSRQSFRVVPSSSPTGGGSSPLLAITIFSCVIFFFCYYFPFDQSLVLSWSFFSSQILPISTSSSALCSRSLHYSLCRFYHSQWMHLLLPPGFLLSFNFDTYLHYLPEKNYRGLERTAGSSSYSFPEVVTIG